VTLLISDSNTGLRKKGTLWNKKGEKAMDLIVMFEE
jgi:hypothetical protein